MTVPIGCWNYSKRKGKEETKEKPKTDLTQVSWLSLVESLNWSLFWPQDIIFRKWNSFPLLFLFVTVKTVSQQPNRLQKIYTRASKLFSPNEQKQEVLVKSSKKLGSRWSSGDESRLIVEKIPHYVAVQIHRNGAPGPILQSFDLAVQGIDPRFLAASIGTDLVIVLKNCFDVGFSLLHFRHQQSELDWTLDMLTQIVVAGGRRTPEE